MIDRNRNNKNIPKAVYSPFTTLLEGEVHNFETSKRRFPDLYAWAERLKELIHLNPTQNTFDPIEYLILLNLINKSYNNSILLSMKCLLFHAFTIARLGVETFINIAIIETDFDRNIKIWRDYNYPSEDNKDSKNIRKKYEDCFRYKKKKHDYSDFMSNEDMNDIIGRWEYLSSIGSHSGYIQTIFCHKMSDTNEEQILNMGYFDVDFDDESIIVEIIMWIIDTFFIITKNISNIFTRHGIVLYKDRSKIDRIIDDWVKYKLEKAKSFKYIKH